MQNLEEAIRERAYHLWAADGRPDGNAEAYWLSAQREILATSLDNSVTQVAESGVTEPVKKAKARSGKSKRRAA
jgi:tRNA A37 N6-isopentenylltransferase MiaA